MSYYIKICSNCGESYENTLKVLEEHYYGDNPYACACSEIMSNKTEKFVLLPFKKFEIKHTAQDELLDYKRRLNEKLLSDSFWGDDVKK